MLADISYAQVEDAIEKRAMRLAQRFEIEPSSSSAVKPTHTEDLKNYAMSVITEVRSFEQAYSKILPIEKQILSRSQLFFACVDGKLLEFIRDDQLAMFREIMYMHRKGTHKGIRLITSIDSSLINVVEKFLSLGVEVKHISDVTSRQFMVSDLAVLDVPNLGTDLDQSFEVEHNSALVRSHLEIFEGLWKSAIDAKEQISELKFDSTS